MTTADVRDVVSLATEPADALLDALARARLLVRSDSYQVMQLLERAEIITRGLTPTAQRSTILLGSTAESLEGLQQDLAWRLEWARSQGVSGRPLRLPGYRTMGDTSLRDLVERLGEAENLADQTAIIDELAIRVLLSPSDAVRLANMMSDEQLRGVTYEISREIDRELNASVDDIIRGRGLSRQAEIRETGGSGLTAASPWGRVLAAMSQTPIGRERLESVFALRADDDRDERINGVSALIPVMLHGEWDGAFVADIIDSLLADPGELGEIGSAAGWAHNIDLPLVSSRLVDPFGVLIEALARDQAAAAHWFLAGGGSTLLEFDRRDGIFLPHHDYAVVPGSRMDEAFAEIVSAAIIGPIAEPSTARHGARELHLDAAWEWFAESLPLVDEKSLHGPATAMAFADVINVFWDRIAPSANASALPTNYVGDAVAAIVNHAEALPRLAFGYGVYLEAVYGAAIVSGDAAAIDGAHDAAFHGFEFLDAGLDRVTPSDDDRALFRQGLDAALGFGAKQGLARLGVAGGWAGVAAGFVTGAVIDELVSKLAPAAVDDRRSSQSVLEELFVPNTGADGSRQRLPAPANIAVANALIAADPNEFRELPDWARDGIVTPKDPSDLPAFGAWFHDTFEDNGLRERLVFDLVEELAVRADVVTG